MEWADAAVWKAVLSSRAASSDEKIMKLFYHLHLTQRAFLRLWQCEQPEGPYPEFTGALPMVAWARTWYAEAFTFLSVVTEEELSRQLPVPWASLVEKRTGHPPEETTLADTVIQVPMHSQYHRAQINTRLKESGGEPPIVDYIAWIWMGKPQAVWPDPTINPL